MVKTVYLRDNKKGELKVLGDEYSNLLPLLSSKKPFLYCVSLKNDTFQELSPYLDSFVSFANSLEVIEPYNIPIEKTINALKGKDSKKKKFILEFIKHADLSVEDFFYNEKAVIKEGE